MREVEYIRVHDLASIRSALAALREIVPSSTAEAVGLQGEEAEAFVREWRRSLGSVADVARLLEAKVSEDQDETTVADALKRFRAIVEGHLEHRPEAGPTGEHKTVSCLALVRVGISDYEQELRR